MYLITYKHNIAYYAYIYIIQIPDGYNITFISQLLAFERTVPELWGLCVLLDSAISDAHEPLVISDTAAVHAITRSNDITPMPETARPDLEVGPAGESGPVVY